MRIPSDYYGNRGVFMNKRYRRTMVSSGKIIIALLLTAFVVIYIFFENQIAPNIRDITRVKAEELCTNAVNTAVVEVLESGQYSYGDFAQVNKTESSVINISTNSVKTNKFKSEVSLKAQEEIKKMSGMTISYNLGDFFGSQLFAGRGPDVLVQLYFSSSVVTDMQSSFEVCGINQTKHTLNIIVTCKVYITSDSNSETYTTVSTTIPVAENIIIGDVPAFYSDKK